MALETTLILFKPDAIEKHLTGKVLGRFEEAGFTVRGIKMMQLDDAILREHYAHVADKPFFPEIVAFMSRRSSSSVKARRSWRRSIRTFRMSR